jgi:hypothetical protein
MAVDQAVQPAPSSAPPLGSQLQFYQRPEALTPERHGNLRLKKDGDFGFARLSNAVAVTSTEFVAAMRSYPIVFSAKDAHPVVVLGLEQENLFVEADGHWRAGQYIPAYIRRYPFVFITHPDGKQFVLGVDRSSIMLTESGEGHLLFEDGKPSEITQQALAFCGAYQTDFGFTTAFGQALEEQKLLIDNQAQAQLPGGKLINLTGFRVVDCEKLASLPDAVIIDWHKRGWLALVQYHLASLDRFSALLELQGTQASN